ncbi:Kae1-associated serine/threonine protein kinase [Candidatus Pacearchaeota archaeon]|nr:Kae1-associated serine/threonine protein kinase [Candidatus Pacearchaeota archaeon]
MKEKIIQQGAEAVLIRRGELVLKRRVKKGYRLAEIDEKIRKLRTRGEARLMEKAGKLISVPLVKRVDEKGKEIEMEFVDGLKLSESLDSIKNWREVCLKIGENIAKLHDAGIIHGDLTTSNMIWVEGGAQIGRNGKLYFIDFGLGYANGRAEDKAVDLHLIKQALEAKHFEKWVEYWKEIEGGYLKTSKNSGEVLKRLEKVERRGRYKEQF